MLFFKSKAKEEELLPPPPPFPAMELEEEKETEISKAIKPEAKEKEEEFQDLFKEVEGLKPKKISKEKIGAKKEAIIKKPKALKKEIIRQKTPKKLKTATQKRSPIQKIKGKKTIKKSAKLKKEKLDDLGFILPKELEEPSEKEIELPEELKYEEIKLPETLEDFDIEGFEKELEPETKTKPKEIMEAEEEIKSAIEKIKEEEKPSFIKRLFARNEGFEEKPEVLMPELTEVNNISAIQNSISKAREALMKFDLGNAKKNYIDVMKLYNNLQPEEQAKVYHDIRDLYFERKSAEELKA